MRTPNADRGWRAGWLVVAVVLATAAPAPAFYWAADWPGSRVSAQPTLIPKTDSANPANPPHPGGNPFPIPGGESQPPTIAGPHEPGQPPATIPEPATALLGLFGLGAVAVRRWARKPARCSARQ